MSFTLNANKTYYIADPCYLLAESEYESHIDDMLGNMAVMYSKTTETRIPFLWIKTFGGDVGANVVNNNDEELIISGNPSKSLAYYSPEDNQKEYNLIPPESSWDLYDFTSAYTYTSAKKLYEASACRYGSWYLFNDSASMSIVPEELVESIERANRMGIKIVPKEDTCIDMLALLVDGGPPETYLSYSRDTLLGVF